MVSILASLILTPETATVTSSNIPYLMVGTPNEGPLTTGQCQLRDNARHVAMVRGSGDLFFK